MDNKTVVQAKKDVATVKLSEPKPASGKKPYTTPKLVVYGDISAITKSVSNKTTHADGGTGLTNKTR